MLVQQILKSKADENVVTVKPGTTLTAVAELLTKRRIGSVIVSTDGRRVAGIVSERDIVRELATRGPACMADVVDKVMTVNVVGCTVDETADHVLERMTHGRFRHMPVMIDDKMVGLISIGDVVKARLAELSMEKDALTGMIMGT